MRLYIISVWSIIWNMADEVNMEGFISANAIFGDHIIFGEAKTMKNDKQSVSMHSASFFEFF